MNAEYSKKINELVEYLNTCRDQYYNHNNSIITDKQYDDLFDELSKLEEESGIILSNSPTQNVGYVAVSSLEKSVHKKPLLSLDKTKLYKDVLKFCADKDVLFMLKMDGLTICCTYNDGSLFKVETRGNGEVGEDITHNAPSILGIPKTIPIKEEVCIIGEAIITQKDFEYINSKLSEDEKYKTARNLASGSIRQYDPAICFQRKVRFIAWNADDLSEDGTMTNGLDVADRYGFITVPRYPRMHLSNMTEQKVEELFTNLKTKADRMSYPIDGIVIRFNNIEYGESLGVTSHHPRNAIAFKFYDDLYETTLRDIEWTIGKTFTLTPTAIFDSVDIDGTDVSRASLSNISILKQTLNIAYKGQTVWVSKRNQVIPKIEKADTSTYNLASKVLNVPTKCPYCGSDTYTVTSGSGTETLYCSNHSCKGALLKKFSMFVSKQGMDIDGLSDRTLEKFIELGWLKTYSDIYTELLKHIFELSKIDGFGEKSVTALLNSIEKSRKTTLAKLFTAISIENIGKQNAIDLANFYDNEPNNVFTKDVNSLINVNGFGEIMVNSVRDWLNSEEDMQEYKNLISILTFESPSKKESNKLNGMKFVITGSLSYYSNRTELVSVIERNGGKVMSSVTKETSFLINNDIESNSSKNKKAKELGVPIITEANFVSNMNGDMPKIKKATKKNGLF